MAHHFPAMEQVLVLRAGDLNQRRLCAPLQQNLNAVHVVELDIHGENLPQLYLDFLQKIIRRGIQISPGTYYGKAITPYPNPANGAKGHSYFRVQWRSSTDTDWTVEFIVRDYDLYLLGFRRRFNQDPWSIWYCFRDDLGWPDFFPENGVEQLFFDGGHLHVGVGGAATLSYIFYTLALWNPNDGQTTVIDALQQAMVFISEALRFYWVEDEMVYRIVHNVVEPRHLNFTQHGELPMWKRIGNWRNFSRIALEAGLNNGMINTSQKLREADSIYRVYSFMDMMNGLRVLKRVEACRALEPRGRQLRVQYGQHVLDPGFIALNEEYPEEAAEGNWWFQ